MSTKSSVLTNTVSSFKFQRSLKSVGVKLFLVLLVSLLISTPISTFLNGMLSGLIDDLPASVAIVLNTIVSLAVTAFLFMLAVRLLILNPLYETVRTMKKVANGDLRTELDIQSKDEFG
ncbi:HAMP domain-containing protein [Pseudalkalibacillus sp. A8]|uniref:HAMP domain-containing protein n=1 Tax=Pseudalkalibacillus sp. A8 TaxID=3382641 RepID=UPI0038B42679